MAEMIEMEDLDPNIEDFDSSNPEDQETLDNTFEENRSFFNRGENEPLSIYSRRIGGFFSKFRRGGEAAYDYFRSKFPRSDLPAYERLENTSEEIPMDNLSKQRVDALLLKYPDVDESLIHITTDEKGKQRISFLSVRKGDWTEPEVLYNEDKTVRKNADKQLRSGRYKKLQTQRDELETKNDTLREEEEGNSEQIRRNNEERAETTDQARQREIDRENERLGDRNSVINDEIAENDAQIERLEERMSLKDRVKAIFKKYGFTVTAVVTAVGVVIGVIVSNLKAGLTSVAKGVGNGLKAIGKKLGEMLPGMVGAIASFLFKTAGEVVGFLAKNAWLLIVAVIIYFIEQLKKKRR